MARVHNIPVFFIVAICLVAFLWRKRPNILTLLLVGILCRIKGLKGQILSLVHNVRIVVHCLKMQFFLNLLLVILILLLYILLLVVIVGLLFCGRSIIIATAEER